MKYTVFGDSILKGVLFEDGKYRRDRSWEEELSRDLGAEITNRSRFGGTIEKALPMLRNTFQKKGEPGEIVLLEYGGNDCDYDWAAIAEKPGEKHVCHTPPERFLAKLREAVELIRGSGRTPALMSLPPIHSERYLAFLCRNGLSRDSILRWLGDVERIARWQETYSNLVTQLAIEERILFIDVRSAFPHEKSALAELLCDDGIHPNRAGQERIYRVLRAKGLAL